MNLFILLLTSLWSCTVEPQPIEYGKDKCHHCGMIITDNRYGTEIVTKKGKVFKYDSIECMALFLAQKPEEANQEMVLVADYTKPGQLIDAATATFLQSGKLPSPMGMFLTAFPDEATAHTFHAQKGGRVMNWAGTQQACVKHERVL